MRFGPCSIADAEGAILAHAVRTPSGLLRKGRVLSQADIDALHEAGASEVTVARLEDGDIGEDEAAARIAKTCAGEGVRIGAAFTGRTNLYADMHGVVVIEASRIAALNAIDESITVATLAPYAAVDTRQMLATIKIIPFAAPRIAVEQVELILKGGAAIHVAPFQSRRAALISTAMPGTKASLLDKNRSALDSRLGALGSSIVFERRVAHHAGAVATALGEAKATGADPILVFGASAITDRRDVIPAAIEQAGGAIEHFGMPVDPGNLLLLGRLGDATVIGLPGCARSPKLNGFDFVLQRVLADLPVSRADIAAMGVGGLLTEIHTRPQPRDQRPIKGPRAPKIAAIVLAAGLSSRMGRNKLLADIAGKPLVRRVAETASASSADPVIVVSGNASADTIAALAGLNVSIVENPDFRNGLSTSLKCGLRALPGDCDGAIVLLGDMPAVMPALIEKLIAAFDPAEGCAICVATYQGKRGNPVLWARQFFPDMLQLEGDVGAKHLMATNSELVCEVEAADDAPLIDIDTPEALIAYAARTR
jgi:molybdenum cofactor cytidylyltransferase